VQTFEPEGASRWSHDEDELFERHAKSALQDMKTSDWKYADILWQGLQVVSLATTKRIIAHAVFLCAERGDVPPPEVGAAAIRLLVGERSRFPTHDANKFDAAKSYAARRPKASLREIANFAGVHFTSIREWKRQDFILERNDRNARTILASYLKYCTRFSSPFGLKTISNKHLNFFAFIPLIENALSELQPIGDVDARAVRLRKLSAWEKKYIVAHAIGFCAKRRKAPPLELARAARALLVRDQPRFRARDEGKLIKAALILASRPQASLREVGNAVGVHHTTVKLWLTQDRFKKAVEERQHRRAVVLYRKYSERFGSPFATGDFPKPRKVDLTRIARLLERALADGQPISDAASLAAAFET
jgi:hypothetical protein